MTGAACSTIFYFLFAMVDAIPSSLSSKGYAGQTSILQSGRSKAR